MNKLVQIIKDNAKNKNRYVISIDGPAASGKSTLADYLQKELDATVFHMDDYFLPNERKTEQRLKEPGGNVDYERMIIEVLNHLETEHITYQKYNCMISELEPFITKKLKKFIIIEGVYSQQQKLHHYYDFNILTEVDKNTQLERLRDRNERLLQRFVEEWLPLEELYFNYENLEESSDYKTKVSNLNKI